MSIGLAFGIFLFLLGAFVGVIATAFAFAWDEEHR